MAPVLVMVRRAGLTGVGTGLTGSTRDDSRNCR